MVSNLNRSLLAILVLGLAATGSNARAGTDYTPGSYDSYGGYDSYNCLGNICVGMTVRIVSGELSGYGGQVISVDQYQDEITLVSSSGYTLTARSYDVIADIAQPSTTGCVANICIGDQVRVTSGYNAGRIGTVVDADDYNYTATILVGGTYIIEDVRDLSLNVRPTNPRPFPNYPRNCGYGDYVYDIYRGCVRISYPYPRPYPHPQPYPRTNPRPYPQPPRGRPVPPRPYPQPRGPMPSPQGPRAPQYPRGSQYPQGGYGGGQHPQGPRAPQYPRGGNGGQHPQPGRRH